MPWNRSTIGPIHNTAPSANERHHRRSSSARHSPATTATNSAPATSAADAWSCAANDAAPTATIHARRDPSSTSTVAAVATNSGSTARCGFQGLSSWSRNAISSTASPAAVTEPIHAERRRHAIVSASATHARFRTSAEAGRAAARRPLAQYGTANSHSSAGPGWKTSSRE
ncbi:MAG: hypothetical protein R2697_12950 [Ilumatobacteraceae bacterium]